MHMFQTLNLFNDTLKFYHGVRYIVVSCKLVEKTKQKSWVSVRMKIKSNLIKHAR